MGDEIEFDGHLVTVESFESQEPYVNEVITRPTGGMATSSRRPITHPVTATPPTLPPSSISQVISASFYNLGSSIFLTSYLR